MYRIFSMGVSGRLYQLGSAGWVDSDGTNFPDHTDVAEFLSDSFTPALPGGEPMADSYVARVDPSGLIMSTYSYDEVCCD